MGNTWSTLAFNESAKLYIGIHTPFADKIRTQPGKAYNVCYLSETYEISPIFENLTIKPHEYFFSVRKDEP